LILNRLVHDGKTTLPRRRAGRLTVQWLAELWRKYHKGFTLIDASVSRWRATSATTSINSQLASPGDQRARCYW